MKWLAESLRQSGNQVRVVCPDDSFGESNGQSGLCTFRYAPRSAQILAHSPGGIPAAIKRNRLNYVLVPVFLLAFLLKILRQKKTDIILANWAVTGLLGGLAGRITGTPVVVVLRGSDIHQAQKGVNTLILKSAMRLCQSIVTVGESQAELLKKSFPRYTDKLVTIPNGFPKELLEGEAACESLEPIERIDICFVGSLIEGKGCHILLAAIRTLSKERNIRLSIIGDGPERNYLESAAEGLDVRFYGSLAQEEAYQVMRRSQIFVLPSFAEGRPNALIEALALGLVCVGSDIPAVRDILAGKVVSGYLFASGDEAGLTARIREILENPEEARSRTMSGRDLLSLSGNTWEATAKRYESLLNQVRQERTP